MKYILRLCLTVLIAHPPGPADAAALVQQGPFVIVLGVAQDGGIPQAGRSEDPAWSDPGQRRLVTSLALVDPRNGARWLFDATPDFRQQLQRLDVAAPIEESPGLAGIFLTHAHIGHYTGLMFLGHESIGASGVPVHAMPRFAEFIERNGPWSQLVEYNNIELRRLEEGVSVPLARDLAVTPLLVPHRQEYAEVVGYRIDGPERSVLFIPDIDSWDAWDERGTRIEDLIAEVDIAFLDGTFFADGEIPDRDMSDFPHPFITHSMERFHALPASERAKVRFIHLNHTNPAARDGSEERLDIERRGFRLAAEGETIGL